MKNDTDVPAAAHDQRRWWACGDVLDVSEGVWSCGLPRGHGGVQHRSDAADMYWQFTTYDLDTGEVSPPVWLCPCRTCPRCGYVSDPDDKCDPDRPHPEDGLAVCLNCKPLWSSEWWAHVGPHMDGRCPLSAAAAEEWSAHDFLVMAGVR